MLLQWSICTHVELLPSPRKTSKACSEKPQQRNAAKKTLATLGLDYENIHACPNDHVLFRKELANEVRCPQCHASHFREDVQGNRVPNKVLRHFPLIPRIKHMFRCREIPGLMSWHAENRSTDGNMCAPADNPRHGKI